MPVRGNIGAGFDGVQQTICRRIIARVQVAVLALTRAITRLADNFIKQLAVYQSNHV
jgi:hypothetical protein